MTERERWVIYPLLFLALGASLRDKLGGSLTAKRIVCQELRIEDEPSGNEPARTLALIGRTESSASSPSVGVLAVNGALEVNGVVKVNGVVSSSKGYAYGDKLMMPAPQRPVVSLPDLLQALKEAQARQQQNGAKPQAPANPPAASPPTPALPATPPAQESKESSATDEGNEDSAPPASPEKDADTAASDANEK